MADVFLRRNSLDMTTKRCDLAIVKKCVICDIYDNYASRKTFFIFHPQSLDTLRELASSLQWQDRSQVRHKNSNNSNNNNKSVSRRLSFKEPTTSRRGQESSNTGRRQSHPEELGAATRRRKSSTSFQDVIAQVGILDPLPRKWSTGIVEDLTSNTRNVTAVPPSKTVQV